MDISNKAKGLIMLIVGIIIVFTIVSATAPSIQSAGNNVSAGISENVSLPLSSLFSGSGVVILIFMASIVLFVIRSVMKKK